MEGANDDQPGRADNLQATWATRVIGDDWRQCKACGMWVRKVTTIEERVDTPPEREIDRTFALGRKLSKVPIGEHRIDPDELAICKQRGHATDPGSEGWEPCSACGTWLRERRTIEEREDKPLRDQRGPEFLSQ